MKADREKLLATLASVAPGLARREIVEQTASFVFTGGEVVTYNDEVACRAKSGLGDVEGAMASRGLLAILQKLDAPEVDVSVEGGELLVRAGKGESTGVKLEPEITLPYSAVEEPKDWRPLHRDFLAAVDIVQQCAGKDESQFALTCVHVHPKWVEACDNFQLTRYRLKTGVGDPLLVRRDSLRHVVPLGPTEFARTKNWLHFRNDALTISCRLYLEEYKDLGGILKGTGQEQWQPARLPRGLAEAADRAAVFSSENVDDDQVLIELSSGKLKVTGQGHSGWYRKISKIDYAGEPMSFLISPKLLQEISGRHSECSLAPGRMRIEGDKWTYMTCLGTPAAPSANGDASGSAAGSASAADGEGKPRKKKRAKEGAEA